MANDRELLPERIALPLFLAAEEMCYRRFNTLTAVQAGGLAGWYVLYNDGDRFSYAVGLMVCVTLIGLLLWVVAEYDRSDARHYRAILEEKYPWLVLRGQLPRPVGIRGRDVVRMIGGLLLVVNIIVIVCTIVVARS